MPLHGGNYSLHGRWAERLRRRCTRWFGMDDATLSIPISPEGETPPAEAALQTMIVCAKGSKH